MKNSIKGALLVLTGMVAGTLISVGVAGPTTTKSTLPLSEIRQFTDVYGAVKQFYVDPVEDKNS